MWSRSPLPTPTPGLSAFVAWKESTHIATKIWLYACLFGYFVGCAGGYAFTSNCPAAVFEQFQIYRVLAASFFPRDWLNGLFAIIMLYQNIGSLERRAGSVFAFLFPLFVGVLSNALFLVMTLAINAGRVSSQANPDSTLSGAGFSSVSSCSAGMWATAFGVLAYEACLASHSEPERRFYCFPCQLPTKWQPLLLVLLFSIFMGVSIDSYLGLIIGYSCALLACLQPYLGGSVFTAFVARAESNDTSTCCGLSCVCCGACSGACFGWHPLAWLPRQPNYVSLAAVQSGVYIINAAGADSSASSAGQSHAAPSSAPIASLSSRPSWSTGAGYSLQNERSSSSLLSSFFGGGPNESLTAPAASAPSIASGAAPPARPGSILADRLDRLKQQELQQKQQLQHHDETGSHQFAIEMPSVSSVDANVFTPLPADYFSRPRGASGVSSLSLQSDSLSSASAASSAPRDGEHLGDDMPSNPYAYQTLGLPDQSQLDEEDLDSDLATGAHGGSK
jgi:hypothetical protein